MGGCSFKPSGEVSVAILVDGEFASPILDAFERSEENISLIRQMEFDALENIKSWDRLIERSTDSQWDILWNDEILSTILLQQKDLLIPKIFEKNETIPSEMIASDGSWIGVGARARVLLVNREKLPKKEDWPQSLLEMSDPKWNNQFGFSNPMSGTSATQFAIMATHFFENKSPRAEFFDWVKQVFQNGVVVANESQLVSAVSEGRLTWCVTDTDQAWIAIEKGGPVEIVWPDQGTTGHGLILIPMTVAVFKNARNQMASIVTASYLASKETEGRLVMGYAAEFAIGTKSSRFEMKKIDYAKAATAWNEIKESLETELTITTRDSSD